MWYLLVVVSIFSLLSIQTAYGQEIITVNQTDPCFLNYTAGPELWQNCGFDDDYLTFSLLGWEWVTGGYFSMIVVGIFTMFSYIKYHKMIYPVMIGVLFLPISFFLFPDTFVVWGVLMAFVGIGVLVWYIFIKQTKEY